MKPTVVSAAKVRYLLSRGEYRAHPLRVSARVLSWEAHRILGRSSNSVIDGDVSIRTYPDDGCARLIYCFGSHDPGLGTLLDTYLRPGMIVIDVGANIGAFAMMAARRVGPAGLVLAIEPDPVTYLRLLENIGLNGFEQVVALNCALGESAGEAVLSNNADSSRRFLTPPGEAHGATVPVRTLDDVVASVGIKSIDYLKIDVEGYEMHVLAGARGVLERVPPRVIQMERIPDLLSREQTTVRSIGDFLGERGYVLEGPARCGDPGATGATPVDDAVFVLRDRPTPRPGSDES